jgi:hypothetical protein
LLPRRYRRKQRAGTVQLHLSPDYSFAIGSSSGGSAGAFALAGQPLLQGALTQLALFHYDNALASTSGTAPSQSTGTSFVPGKFGTAVVVAAGGTLSYPEAGTLSFGDGTVEMWVSPRYAGSNAVYTNGNQALLQYWGSSGNELILGTTDNGDAGPYVYVGAQGVYAGYAQVSGIAGWNAGEWHHLAFTYSSSQGRVRIYVDGVLAQEDDAAIPFPGGGPGTFTIGSDGGGNASNFAIDEVRISSNEETAAQIQYDAARSTPFADNEILLPLAGVSSGQLSYSVTGCSGMATYSWTGLPITNPNPPSNLLAPGSTSVTLSFNTLQPASCAYSVGSLLPFASMQAVSTGQKTTSHQATIAGLSSSPLVLNQVYLQCDSNPDFIETLQYRAVGSRSGSFPRIGSIWQGEYILATKPAQAAQIQVYFGPGGMTATQAVELRAQNPNVLILPSVNAQETTGNSSMAPAEYLLRDVNGNPIEDWPGNYLLNLTNPAVPAFLAQSAFQQYFNQANLAFDGIFWDNFNTTISDPYYDYQGVPHQISSNNNGVADNPTTLNAAWSQGIYSLIAAFDQLAPFAYVAAHNAAPVAANLASFNGDSFTFDAPSVREGTESFNTMLGNYQAWFAGGRQPVISTIQSAPPTQIAYGYGYSPLQYVSPSVLQFSQTYYPNMRFGLATALMNDGFSLFDFGDSGAPVNWWFDEYNFALGQPVGPASQINTGGTLNSQNLLINGGFENGAANWSFGVTNDGQAQATVDLDSTIFAEGSSSAHVDVLSVGTAAWHVSLEQDGVSLIAGTNYQLQFWARADQPRAITVNSQGGGPNYPNYGLSTQVSIRASWGLYSASFTAPTTASDGRIQFWMGDVAGNVWIDGVQLTQAPPNVFRRDYTNGAVLLNGTSSSQAIPIESGFQKFSGSQAPLWQYIVDDASAAFTADSSWQVATYDSGVYATGHYLPPFYHAWNSTAHLQNSFGTAAQWNLDIPVDGQYSLQIWLPAAPGAGNWTRDAIYEVVSNGVVLATYTLDQTSASAGDGWHTIATVSLTVAGAPFLRVHNGGAGALLADAVYITSSALFNDGSVIDQVTLGPSDGILLKRLQPVVAPPPAALSIVETHSGNFTQGQSNAIYSVAVSNQPGAGSTIGWVSVTETVPPGLTLVSMTGPGWICPVPGNTCTRSNTLTGGASYEPITITMSVASNAPSQASNQVSVSGGGSLAVSASDPTTITTTNSSPPPEAFFTGETPLGSNVEYLQFSGNIVFGYYSFVASSIFYHYDMGYEAFVSGSASDVYLYDFTSGHWWYTNPTTFPYLYDFTLGSWIYYFPNTTSPGHYTTNPRYFSNLATAQIFTM